MIAYTSGRPTTITDWANVASGIVQASGTGNRVNTLLYDGNGNLIGWADPLNPTGSCPTGGSHVTCLAYTNGLLTGIGRTQTSETLSSGVLGTRPALTTATTIAYRGGDVASVTDAEGVATTFDRTAPGEMTVTRLPATPVSTTKYALVTAADALARVGSIKRKLGGAWIEQHIEWADDASIPTLERYPTEVWKVTENNGGTPSRTITSTYDANSMGRVARVVEPLDSTSTHDRWTDYAYNANNDVTSVTVSRAGSTDDTTPLRTVTVNCWAADPTTAPPTDQRTCPADSGPYLVRTISRYVAGGAVNADTNVATDIVRDVYGRRTPGDRAQPRRRGADLGDRLSGWTHDALGNLTASIANYADGAVNSGRHRRHPRRDDGSLDRSHHGLRL